jgi:hypothetical protein
MAFIVGVATEVAGYGLGCTTGCGGGGWTGARLVVGTGSGKVMSHWPVGGVRVPVRIT